MGVLVEGATPQDFLTEIGGWQALMPADVTIEQDGKPVPLRDHPFVKESKDLHGFAKRAFDSHREVGSRIPVRVDKNNPEAVANWKKEHLPKLYEAGLLSKPPASVEEYDVKKPENLVDGVTWSDERAKKFATVLHKYGVPKEAVPELFELHQEALGEISEIVKTTEAEAEVALRKEFGDKYDALLEQSKRLTPMLFKDERELALFTQAGLANSPFFLGPLMRLAPLAASDSSMGLRMSEQGAVSREEVQAQLADIINNQQNPRHKLYMMGDPATLQYVEDLYKKIPGANEKVVIG